MAQISGLTQAGALSVQDLLMINQGATNGNDGVEKQVSLDSLDVFFKNRKSLSFTMASADEVVLLDADFNTHPRTPPTSPVFIEITITDNGGHYYKLTDYLNFVKDVGDMPYTRFLNPHNYEDFKIVTYGYTYYKASSSSQVSFESPSIAFHRDLIGRTITIKAYSMGEFVLSKCVLSSYQGSGYLFNATDKNSTPVIDITTYGASASVPSPHRHTKIITGSLPSNADETTLCFIP